MGTVINTVAVIMGGCFGLLLKKTMPDRFVNVYFQAIGLFTLILGIQMALLMTNPFIVVLSLVAGALTGEALRLEERTAALSDKIKVRMKIGNERFTEGFITATLMFCMGSMSVIGAIEEGLGRTSDLLLTKSLMDGCSALLLAPAFGVGVVFAALPVLVYQGGISLIVYFFASDIPQPYVDAITAVGGVLLMGLAFNLLKIKQLKIMNLLPALAFVCLFLYVSNKLF